MALIGPLAEPTEDEAVIRAGGAASGLHVLGNGPTAAALAVDCRGSPGDGAGGVRAAEVSS